MQKRLNTSKSKISCTTKSQAVPTTRITDSRACQLQEKKGSCHTHRHMSNNFVGKKGALALSQIIILLVGIFAFTWSIGIVSGGAMPEENPLENLVCESCPQSSSSNIPTSTGKNTATTITSGYTPAQLEKAIKKATESVGEEINNLNKEIAGLEEAGTTSTEKISELGSQLTNKEKELANLQACVKDSGGAGCKDVIEKGTTSKGGSSTLSEWLGIEKLPEGQTAEFWTWQQGGFADGIISGAQYGLMTYGAVKMLGPMLGLDEEETDAASVSLGAGVGVGKLIYTLLGKGGALSGEGTMNTI
ncbi:MAG TPA: hypothetical protein ENH46_04745, partial [Candidatus Pacearchaeota archaeon]|nr:hypothetical protein [Candidatus Pacearchaeota archaeon]